MKTLISQITILMIISLIFTISMSGCKPKLTLQSSGYSLSNYNSLDSKNEKSTLMSNTNSAINSEAQTCSSQYKSSDNSNANSSITRSDSNSGETHGEKQTDGTFVFYVDDRNGDDYNSGTKANPLKSIVAACDYLNAGDTVIVADGVYYGNISPLSGKVNKPITIKAASGSKPKITNTINYNGKWTKYSGNIYMTDPGDFAYKIDSSNFRVYFDCVSGIEACYPNMPGTTPNAMFEGYEWARAISGTDHKKIVAQNLPTTKLKGASIAVMAGAGWNIYTRFISSVEGNVINVTPEFKNVDDGLTGNLSYTPIKGNKYYIYGALALLDSPGEYFIDQASDKVYIYMPDSGSPDGHRIDFQGSSRFGITLDGLNYVNIDGLNLYGNGISMDNSSNCKIEKCSINYFGYTRGDTPYPIGKTSYDFFVAGQNNSITNCEIANTGGSGIGVTGTNNMVKNNKIHSVDYGGMDYAGITLLTGSENIEIKYNSIYDSGRFGIFTPAGAKLKNCIISNNFVKDYGIITADCGAFYTWNTDGGSTQIVNNFVGGSITTNGQVDGLYLDNYCKNFLVHHNIVKVTSAGLRVNLTSTNNLVFNNTIIGCKTGVGMYGYSKDEASMTGTKIYNNLIVDLTSTDEYEYYAAEGGINVGKSGKFINGQLSLLSGDKAPQTGSNLAGSISNSYSPLGSVIDGGIKFDGFIGTIRGTKPDVGALENGDKLFAYGVQ